MPPPGQPRSKPDLSEQTRLEMEAGRRAVAGLRQILIDPVTSFEK